MTRTVNLTPHEVNVVNDAGKVLRTFPESGKVIRLKQETVTVDTILTDGVVIARTKTTFGVADYMPPEGTGVIYIVSRAVAVAIPRRDFVFPNQIIRDDSGKIIGCQSFGISHK